MKKPLTIFDKPANVKRFLIFFFASLVGLLIIDFFVPKHGHFPWEGATDFFAAYGFFACVMLVFIAKGMRLFLKRDEDYYDK